MHKDNEENRIKYNQLLEKKREELTKLDQETKILKDLLQKGISEQITYYSGILKKGTDVRLDGLVWVIRKLMELNAFLDYEQFPKFLDRNHVDYLIKLAKKHIESTQLKLILKNLKDKQKQLRDDNSNDTNMLLSGKSLNTTPFGLKTVSDNFNFLSAVTEGCYRSTLTDPSKKNQKINKLLTKVIDNNSRLMKKVHERQMDDLQVKLYFKYFKNKHY
jgi:hypothetical protein